ncbi:MAG: GIY-YIG nuclease family protein [Robiginitomaculum sp.]|nr:GIY-YIG nuclease family protein [Robiginitomaculum sp.]
MQDRIYSVYILASKRNGTLYAGVTNNLVRRVYEHREKLVAGFTKKYGVSMLVWHEEFLTLSWPYGVKNELKNIHADGN